LPNIELTKVKGLPVFRKIAIGTWRTVGDPSVYGSMEITMDKATDYLKRYREATGKRVTVSHLVAKAVAAALEEVPEANSIMRFNRIYRRKSIGVFFQVAMVDEETDEIDLSGAVIDNVDKKGLGEVIDEFQHKVDLVRNKKDPSLERTRSSFRLIPYFLLNKFLSLISFLSYTLNLNLPGLPKDPFGSVMVTNVGSLGIDQAFAPLVPYSRVPLLLAVGALQKVPVVENDEVVIRKRMKICATFDHRFIDGVHMGRMAKIMNRWLTHPDDYFGPVTQALEANGETA
jgi:pyruvate/2-oxoglutarate dehydrogenase complex dihydrolipoamide acyltransferase (E2) component